MKTHEMTGTMGERTMAHYGVIVRLPTGLTHRAKEWRYKNIGADNATDAGNIALWQAANSSYWRNLGASPDKVLASNILHVDDVWKIR